MFGGEGFHTLFVLQTKREYVRTNIVNHVSYNFNKN